MPTKNKKNKKYDQKLSQLPKERHESKKHGYWNFLFKIPV